MRLSELEANRLIAQCVSDLRNNTTPGQATISQKVERDVYILSNGLSYGVSHPRPVFEAAIDEALHEMSVGVLPVDLSSLMTLVQDKLRSKEPRRFSLLVPFNSSEASVDEIKQAFPDGSPLRTASADEVVDLLPSAGLPFGVSGKDEVEQYCRTSTWLAFDTPHQEFASAFQGGYRRYDLFRAFVNLGLTLNKVTRWVTSLPSPLSPVGTPWFMLLLNDQGGLVDSFFTVPDSHGRHAQLTPEHWKRIRIVSEAYNNMADTQLKHVLSEALVLYNTAGDTSIPDHSFLQFWFIAEMLLSDSKHIVQKMKALYKANASEERMLVEILAEKRHTMVHQGKTEAIDLADINFLRLTVQNLLSFTLFQAKEVMSTYELSDLLGYLGEANRIDKSSRVLSVAKRIAEENKLV